MATRTKFIRHATATAKTFQGLQGEITVDLGKKVARVHDGITPGGNALASEDLSNVLSATTAAAGKMSALQVQELTTATADNGTQAVLISANINAINANAVNIAANTSSIAVNEQADIDNAKKFATLTSVGLSAFTADLQTAPTAYKTGQRYQFVPDINNTGACSISFNGLGVRNISLPNGAPLPAQALRAAQPADLLFDGVAFLLMNLPVFEQAVTMAFYQAAAPLGWTQIVTANVANAMLRVVNGAGGGSGGTGDPITHTHDYTGVVAHTHGFTTGNAGVHNHSTVGASIAVAAGGVGVQGGSVNNTNFPTSGAGNHFHTGVTGSTGLATQTTNAATAIKHLDVIICSKD